MHWIARFGAWRWGPPLAALLVIPALHVGLVIDDYLLLERLGGMRWQGLWDAFSLVGAGQVPSLRELGDLPWWSAPDLRLRFLRPLAALTHALDFALLPPWLMHVESMLWLAALNVAVARWYRRLLPESHGLASALFAIAPGHIFAASWLANRNAVLAALFAVLSLLFYERTRIAVVMLALSLLSGEIGLGASALWIAYALCVDRSWRRLVPGLLVTGAWLVVHHALGYGVHSSGLYVDPLREPLRFAHAFVERMPLLVFGQLGVPAITLALLTAGPLALAALALALWLPRALALLRVDARARFGLLASLLALTPVAATVVHDRLLIVADVAGLGLLAQLLSWRPDRFAAAWAWLRVGSSVLLALGYAASLQQHVEHGEHEFAAVHGPAVVIVNSPCSYYAIQLRRLRALAGGPVPRFVRTLAPGLYPLDIERRDEQTLRLRAAGGLLQPLGVYRSPGAQPSWLSPVYLAQTLDHFPRARWAYRVGNAIELGDLTLRMVQVTHDGYPEAVDFTFRAPLAELPLWGWRDGGYRPFVLPAVGDRVHLPGEHGE